MSLPYASALAHPLALIGVRTFVRLVRTYGVDPGHRLQAAALLLSCGLGVPFRWMDAGLSSRAVARTPLPASPLFVVGHWRSGTTHLHNLLSQDPRFGCLRNIHCVAARSFLGARRVVRAALGPFMPAERPMDAVRVDLDTPQEEEFAMSRIAAMSLFHAFTFPARMREVFDRWVTFDTAAPADVESWKATYCWMLRRVSIDEGGKPLCLKSPPNTARIRVLRELFPDARFVHVYRNPYVVYHSAVNMWRQMIAAGALQRAGDDLEGNVIYFYRRLMDRFFADAAALPAGRIAHVRFEDLESDPIAVMEGVYACLGLEGFDRAVPRVADYLERCGPYRKNSYVFDEPAFGRVEREWGKELARWGYRRPGPAPVSSAGRRDGGPL